ncbi:MAG: 5-bromo-4-chloroindolyl phosphate hydrolysis family protein [Oscillospiraceae bacterium]|nr:5-bromo-4-chloroindolyl phosphate hydrolysis family protein [Oscillospiraceae bacterium]
MNSNQKNDAVSEIMSWVLIGVAFIAFWPLGVFLLFKKLAQSSSGGRHKQVPPLYAPSSAAAGAGGNRTGDKAESAAAAAASKTAAGQETFAQRMMRTPKMSSSSAAWLKVAGIILLIVGGMHVYGELSTVYLVGLTQYEIWKLVGHAAWICGGGALFVSGQRMTMRSRCFQRYYAIIGMSEAVPLEQVARATGYDIDKIAKDLQRMISAGMFGDGAYLDLGLGYFFRSSAAASKVSKEKEKAAPAGSAAPREADEGYSGILRNIRRANDRIADPVLSAKIDRLEDIAGKIFQIVEHDKDKEKRIGTFLNYYLPTTQKLLDSYAEFESTGVDGDNLKEAKHKIEQTMDAIVEGFENQLDMLYQSDAMDVSSDIDVMSAMLKRDSAKSDFTVGATSAPEAEKPEKSAPRERKNLVMRSDGTVGPEDE